MKTYLFIVLAYLVNITSAVSATFYVNNQAIGNDSNLGTSLDSPWETISKVNSYSFPPGSKILLKSGQVWHEQLNITVSGTASQKITYGKYGTGDSPLICAADLVSDGDWQLIYDADGKKIYEYSSSIRRPYGILENGELRSTIYSSSPETNLENLQTGWGTYWKLYYRKDTGVPSNIEVGKRIAIYIGADNIIIDGIDCRGPVGTHVDTEAYIKEPSVVYIGKDYDNILLKNMEIFFGSQKGISDGYLSGLTVYGAVNLDYRYLTLRDNNDTGLYFRASGSGFIWRCKAYNNGILVGNENTDSGGIGVQGCGPLSIYECEVWNNGRDTLSDDFAISIWNPKGKVQILRNYIHHTPGGGIGIWGKDTVYNSGHVIGANIIDSFGYTSSVSANPGKHSGISIQYQDNIKIYNNDISRGGDNQYSQGLFIRYNTENLMLRNNIFYENINADLYIYPSSTFTGFIANFNIYYKQDYSDNWKIDGTRYSSLNAYSSNTGYDTISYTDNPGFVSTLLTTKYGFVITPSSFAAGKGIGVGDVYHDFSGSPYLTPRAIGAYEAR
ncbi:MAG: right-handed parallel beta-helix repeat-containing protein [Victivallaceae bacterium]|nr:right-handed parallel beta-helix repeat-containing protein [Victivallaceae bacterium]